MPIKILTLLISSEWTRKTLRNTFPVKWETFCKPYIELQSIVIFLIRYVSFFINSMPLLFFRPTSFIFIPFAFLLFLTCFCFLFLSLLLNFFFSTSNPFYFFSIALNFLVLSFFISDFVYPLVVPFCPPKEKNTFSSFSFGMFYGKGYSLTISCLKRSNFSYLNYFGKLKTYS